jgi:UDP-N-acetyl-D-glucosamine dehydrogenase
MQHEQLTREIRDKSAGAPADFDCAVLATDHEAFDDGLIKRHARLIVDTRGVYLEPVHSVFFRS